MLESDVRPGVDCNPDDPGKCESESQSHAPCPLTKDGAWGTFEHLGPNGENLSFVSATVANAPVSDDPCKTCVFSRIRQRVMNGEMPSGSVDMFTCEAFGTRPHGGVFIVESSPQQ